MSNSSANASKWFEFMDYELPIDTGTWLDLFTLQADSLFRNADIPLDWWIHIGGPLRRRWEARWEDPAYYWPVDATRNDRPRFVFELAMQPDPVVSFEVRAWLEIFQKRLEVSRESAAYDPKRTAVALSADSAWWKDSFFDSFVKWPTDRSERFVGNSLWKDRLLRGIRMVVPDNLIRDFERHMSELVENGSVDPQEPPWIAWSRIVSFARTQVVTDEVRYCLDRHFAVMRAFLSPQDELAESASLPKGFVMVNPTLDIVHVWEQRYAGEKNRAPLLAICRYHDIVVECRLTPAEAVVIDFIREGFRAEASTVIAHAGQEIGISSSEIGRALQKLKFEGLILGSETVQDV